MKANEVLHEVKILTDRDTPMKLKHVDIENKKFQCPSCLQIIYFLDDPTRYMFCFNCGQRLKWVNWWEDVE